ncbi:phosphomethylpyrimidine synthase ThiC [uncultured Anaeromusa sp.]|uniref:phosphomethylpyrimidine synthase ThiC n=1 Tax=uncultured Anaeromusa sp. TaxID=673273 RepID=UPI0029C7C67F|nr:phosphomethylpyrimidine synthase ThiC [uncultured Anaeromusa sp.]
MCDEIDKVMLRNDDKHIVNLKKSNGILEGGYGKRTLINSLIGINDISECNYELEKISKIVQMKDGPDLLSDLSTIKQNRIESIWYRIIKETPFVAATLPIYMVSSKNNTIDENELLEIIIEQMEYGVGLLTIHPTVSKEIFEKARKRIVPITSRGGGIVVRDLLAKNFKDSNVYLKLLPQIISYARKYKVCLSIGAAFRSANIFDSNDEAQKMEIEKQILIAKWIAKQGVGVIIESPGHARPRDIKDISILLKDAGFPIMPLGPIPTDISIGMDHVSGAIGAVIMGIEGCADILATVTREEHTGGRPTIESTIEAIKVAKISAHIIDINNLNDTESDKEIVKSRFDANTCVLGKTTKYCDRCKELCPLSIR